MVEKIKLFLFDRDKRFVWLAKHGFLGNIPDDQYLKKRFRLKFGRELNLENPKTFCEKLQWLKLYDRRPIYTTMADKYAVKKFVADRIGADHVLPALGVWDRFDDIDFGKLPDQFVLKCTHDSGGFVICKDKATFDKNAAKARIEKALKADYFLSGREWPYKNIPRRIIAEPYIDSLGKPDSVEYKLTCCDGVVKNVTVCTGIAHTDLSKRTNDNFDRDLKPLHWYAYYKNSGKKIEFPEQIHQMIEFAEVLSAGVPQVRVDFYLHRGEVYFGELTFFTWSGFIEFMPPEQDQIMGDWIKLPPKTVSP